MNRTFQSLFLFPLFCTLLCTLLSSCFLSRPEVSFERHLLKTLPVSKKILSLNPTVNTGKEIISPPNTWMSLIELESNDDVGEIQFLCLFYKIPRDSSGGALRLVSSKEACSSNYQDGIISEWGDINDLKFWYPEFDKKIFNNSLKRGFLYLTGHSKKEFFIEIPLFNIIQKESYKRYSSPLSFNLHPGLFLQNAVDPKYIIKGISKIGEFQDNYKDGTAKVCHEFSKDCSEVQPFTCDQCKFGWYSAVGVSTCPGQLMKFCGVNNCGERGMPACPRGIESANRMDKDNSLYCYDGSPVGYCMNGLNTVCDGKILICL